MKYDLLQDIKCPYGMLHDGEWAFYYNEPLTVGGVFCLKCKNFVSNDKENLELTCKMENLKRIIQ